MVNPQELTLTFTYDHTTGVYYAKLPNSARFAVSREHVGGKLENALNLFKASVIALNSGKYVQARRDDGALAYSYDEGQVRKYGKTGRLNVKLPEVELTLEDLEL